ncbi:MAG: hypothetical protein KDK99_11615 [Verrucomicrobiales bacterium]|nr:hypothetical protein [Verrucomicrobiales bacterium]
MSSFHIRPRFEQTLPTSPDTLRAEIVRDFGTQADDFEVKDFPGFICLRIHEKNRHFWSPRLTLGLEDAGEGQTRIRGVYGPNANVWALFLYGYLIFGICAVFSGMLAGCQWVLKMPVWGAWPLGISVALLIALYVIAQTGQKLGVQQTFQIHQAYEAAVHKHVTIH